MRKVNSQVISSTDKAALQSIVKLKHRVEELEDKLSTNQPEPCTMCSGLKQTMAFLQDLIKSRDQEVADLRLNNMKLQEKLEGQIQNMVKDK